MFSGGDSTIFIFVLIAAAVIMAAVWFFLITPMERRNHERKLEILQQRIEKHKEHIGTCDISGDTMEADDLEQT